MLLNSSVSLIRRHWKIIVLLDLIPASAGTFSTFVLAKYLITAVAIAINVAEIVSLRIVSRVIPNFSSQDCLVVAHWPN